MRIGVDLGGTKIEVVALDDARNELFRKRVATPRECYQQTLGVISQLVSETEVYLGQKGTVGVGIPGTVSSVSGKVKNANSTWINGECLHYDLSDRLQREIRVANDANCMALSESIDGSAKGQGVVFAAILGTGCGAGIAINSRVHSGINEVAGEWGHNPLPWLNHGDEPPLECYCGRVNCLETWVSGTGFSQSYQRRTGKALSAECIIENVGQGEFEAIAELELYEHRLARGLAQVINTLDPDVIVLGGGMSNVDSLYQALPVQLSEWVFGGECSTPVVKAMHGDSSGVRGAAFLWGF